MKVVRFVASLFGVATTECKWWKDWGNGRDADKGSPMMFHLIQNFEGKVPRAG